MPDFTPYQSAFFAHRITLEGIGEEALAQSLSTARVDLNPHQVDAALFALNSPLSKGVVMADEVGLGKTIEAALVIAQRWAERRRRILLIFGQLMFPPAPTKTRFCSCASAWNRFASEPCGGKFSRRGLSNTPNVSRSR